MNHCLMGHWEFTWNILMIETPCQSSSGYTTGVLHRELYPPASHSESLTHSIFNAKVAFTISRFFPTAGNWQQVFQFFYDPVLFVYCWQRGLCVVGILPAGCDVPTFYAASHSIPVFSAQKLYFLFQNAPPTLFHKTIVANEEQGSLVGNRS